MIQYNNLNVKLPNSHPNRIKSAIKIGTEVISVFSSNVIGNSNDGKNKSLLNDRQVSRLGKSFANNSKRKLTKTQLAKMMQLRGFLCMFLLS